MMDNTTKPDSLQPAAEKAVDLFDNWFDPIETEVRVRAREFMLTWLLLPIPLVLFATRLNRPFTTPSRAKFTLKICGRLTF
jgi:putative transposase